MRVTGCCFERTKTDPNLFRRALTAQAQGRWDEAAHLCQSILDASPQEFDAAHDIMHFGPELTDFLDTAALASSMDLVISVDTSVAHLTATLGVETWLLLPFTPDWRWLVDRDDSPWYPSIRIFRQPTAGYWPSVMASVRAALETRVAAG